MISRVLIFLMLAIGLSACLPDGDETIVLSFIPVEFLRGWNVGLRCEGQDYDAIVIDFEIENLKSFRAEGDGEDYNGALRHAVFEAEYNPKTDILSATIYIYNIDQTVLLRTDVIEVVWKEYDGGYIPMSLTKQNPDYYVCPSEVILRFTEEELTTEDVAMVKSQIYSYGKL